jgi:hypothetical protein
MSTLVSQSTGLAMVARSRLPRQTSPHHRAGAVGLAAPVAPRLDRQHFTLRHQRMALI